MRRSRWHGLIVAALAAIGGRSPESAGQLALDWARQYPTGQGSALTDSVAAIGFLDQITPPEQSVFVAGQRTLDGAGTVVFAVAKYDTAGNFLAEVTWPPNPETGKKYVPTAMAVTAPYGLDQNQPVVFVTGYVPGVNGTKDARTVAFKSDLGFKWEQTWSYQPPLIRYNGDDTPVAIAALATRVAVALTSQSGTGGDDIQLLTYERGGGAPLSGWDQTRFSAGPSDYAIGVQFSGLTDLVLTGNLNDTIAAWYLQETNFAYGVVNSRQYAPAFSAYGRAMHHVVLSTGAAITYLAGNRVAGSQKDLLLVRFNWGLPNASATWYDEPTGETRRASRSAAAFPRTSAPP